tara:strand:+ start:256 stop:558 length:303 start_codon:yes stop_codon:yes gene_type:complete
MKKKIFLILIFLILNGCAEYSSLFGPTYTIAKTGSTARAGTSLLASYGFEQGFGAKPGEVFMENTEVRTCEVTHSSDLSQIFFHTLDEIDCVRDKSSILR